MRRNKAVLQIITREPRLFCQIFAISAAGEFILHADNRKLKPQKLGETAFRRGAHANNCNAEMLSCDTINHNAKGLRAVCVFESRTEYRAPN